MGANVLNMHIEVIKHALSFIIICRLSCKGQNNGDQITLCPWKIDRILFDTPNILCSSRKYPYSPHRRDWNFLGGGGFCKVQKI